jgi:sugar/nucleoside kinase (ribokinase family)
MMGAAGAAGARGAGNVMSVVIAGHVTHDRYGDELVAGGCAFYGAHVHAGLGAQVRLVAGVGEDFACDHALTGIARRMRRAGRTTRFTNRYPAGGPRVQQIEAQAPAVTPELVPAAWQGADLLHLAPVMEEIDLAAWVKGTRARFVGIGLQGWVKTAGAGGAVVQRRWQVDAAALAGVHAACVGEEDLIDQGDLLDRLVAAVPVVALTRGRAGCEVIERGRTTWVGVHPAREVDPTGAGDAFAAGFLQALASGETAPRAARLGAAAASIVIEGRGGETLGRIGEARGRAGTIPVGAVPADPPERAAGRPGAARSAW